jgi:hypothetical protein
MYLEYADQKLTAASSFPKEEWALAQSHDGNVCLKPV